MLTLKEIALVGWVAVLGGHKWEVNILGGDRVLLTRYERGQYKQPKTVSLVESANVEARPIVRS